MSFYGDPPPDDATILLLMLRASADRWQSLDTVRPLMLRTRCMDDDLQDVCVADDDLLTRRLEDALAQLSTAGLVDVDGNRFLTTERGQQALQQHPHGIDGSVLMAFSEYRSALAAQPMRAEHHPKGVNRAREAGLFAHGSGRRPTENPHEPDTLEHLAWQEGWHKARDEEARETERLRLN